MKFHLSALSSQLPSQGLWSKLLRVASSSTQGYQRGDPLTFREQSCWRANVDETPGEVTTA